LPSDMTLSMDRATRLPRTLDRFQKAAIIVRLLRAEGLDISLTDLPDRMQIALTDAMTAMRYIDRVTLRNVVEEFVNDLDAVGLSFPPDVTGVLNMMDGSISENTAAHLRIRAGLEQNSDPWERLGSMEPEDLLPILEEESIEIGAVVLSKIRVRKSAELLGMLPGERARRITYAMSRTNAISLSTVREIGEALVAQFDTAVPNAFEVGAVERVGAILNSSMAATRNDMLLGLDDQDKSFAEDVRKAIFTFNNIPERIEARDIPKVIRDVVPDTLTLALAAASKDPITQPAVDFILENISQRMAGQMRDDMLGLTKFKKKEGEEAMAAVVTSVRNLESTGEIALIQNETDED